MASDCVRFYENCCMSILASVNFPQGFARSYKRFLYTRRPETYSTLFLSIKLFFSRFSFPDMNVTRKKLSEKVPVWLNPIWFPPDCLINYYESLSNTLRWKSCFSKINKGWNVSSSIAVKCQRPITLLKHTFPKTSRTYNCFTRNSFLRNMFVALYI